MCDICAKTRQSLVALSPVAKANWKFGRWGVLTIN